jgi:hypothetical protein
MIPRLIHFRFIRPCYGLFKYRISQGSKSRHIVSLQEYQGTFHYMQQMDRLLQLEEVKEEEMRRVKEEYDAFLHREGFEQGIMWRESSKSKIAYAIIQREHNHFF